MPRMELSIPLAFMFTSMSLPKYSLDNLCFIDMSFFGEVTFEPQIELHPLVCFSKLLKVRMFAGGFFISSTLVFRTWKR